MLLLPPHDPNEVAINSEQVRSEELAKYFKGILFDKNKWSKEHYLKNMVRHRIKTSLPEFRLANPTSEEIRNYIQQTLQPEKTTGNFLDVWNKYFPEGHEMNEKITDHGKRIAYIKDWINLCVFLGKPFKT